MNTKILSIITCATFGLLGTSFANDETPAKKEVAKELTKAELTKIFDKDGDGKLNAEEKKASRAAKKADELKKFDKDGDGKLSKEEKKAASEAKKKAKEGKKVKDKSKKAKAKKDGADGQN